MRWRPLIPVLVVAHLVGCSPDPRPSHRELVEQTRAMDIVVVVLDAAAAGHFPFHGYERPTTPRLSALAEESVVFQAAYAQASATPLSVYSYLTSRYPLMNREAPAQGEVAPVFRPGTATVASVLAARYPRRGAFSANQWVCRRLGYDTGFTDFHELWDETATELGQGVAQLAPRVTEAAVEWLAQPGPYFAYLHYLEPHTPYTPPSPYAERFDPEFRGEVDGTDASLAPYRRTRPDASVVRNTIGLYDGNIAFVDDHVGQVVDALRARGTWDQTILVVTSDHGEAFWEHGVRGHGLHVYEEFVRVPLLVRVPGFPALAGMQVETPVQLVDLLPTLADLADVEPPHDPAPVGSSWVPWFVRDRDEARPPVAWFRNHVGGRWIYGVRDGRWKYITHFDRAPRQLFDLQADPGETRNLATDPEAASVGERLRLAMDAWIKAGMARDAGLVGTGADSLDAESRERLRAMGYFH